MVITYSRYNDIWKEVLQRLEQRITDQVAFTAFFATTKLHGVEGDTAIVSTPNNFSAQVLNRRFVEDIQAVFNEVTQSDFRITIKDEHDLATTDEAAKTTPTISPFYSNLNPKYTFDNFIVGPSNQEVNMAVISTAMDPGKYFNPLFIYGRSGLGKTHLLHAAGNYIRSKFANLQVLYITSDDFMEEYIRSIKEKGVEVLKDKFRNVDVLLVDDVQFFSSKEKTSEMFFNIFNQFINNGKQIILTSDRSPAELQGLETRLLSRFASGLSVAVKAPEFATALAILHKKVEALDLGEGRIEEEVLVHIAKKYASDVRQLEGALNKLLFHAITFKKKDRISLPDAMETFENFISVNEKKSVTFDKIKMAVSQYYNISPLQLEAKLRTSNLVTARHIAIYLCHTLLDTTLSEIGRTFGGRDHSTVINAYEKVEKLLKENVAYQVAIDDIKKMLKND